ncbi:MAG: PD-(D/E)XK nuclease family protein [Opitutae bacterium]|nr:PD-(D/E)XK nuclease family protein [Opitutae bacterium]
MTATASPVPRLQVLPWTQPLPRAAAAWLALGWAGGGPLDLSATLAVVPTRQSGRRLREALATLAAERGQAVLPPRVVLPEDLLRLGAPAGGVASRLEAQLAWAEVLRALPLEEFRDVFPVDPPERNFAWAQRLGAQLGRVQATLAEAGLRLADVAANAGAQAGDFPEAERWRQLGAMEERYDAALAARGLRDAQAAKIAWAAAPELPPGIARIVVLATPDPLPLAVRVLATHARRVPVTVLVVGPADEVVDGLFDAWGRPRAEVWASRPLAWPDFAQRVHLCADPAAQAEQIVALARAYGPAAGAWAVGLADPDVLPALDHGLLRAGFAPYDPEGTPRRREALHALLTALAEFAREPNFDAVAALARCPDVLGWLRAEIGPAFAAAPFLAALDELRSEHLPPTLAEAQRHAAKAPAPLAAALDRLGELRALLNDGALATSAPAALARLFAARTFDLAQPGARRVADAAEAWRDTVAAVAAAAARFPGVREGEWWELALGLFGDSTRFDDKPADAVELLGWLELLWEDAPHLVVAGLNDGRVPEAVVGDAFLPESLREKLGLKTNAARFARDAYLLAALAAQRGPHGRLDLLVGKVSAAGDPLRPSRLLLLCADAELPDRVRWLFREIASVRPSLPWRRAWPLRPPPLERPLATLSVTAFRDYLACPFRFYLKHARRMEAVDPAKAELDARDFGNLCHAALQALGEQRDLRDCADEGALADFLLGRLEAGARDRYGALLPLPLLVQMESARQRLRKAATVQARLRAEGWVIERVEWKFPATPALTLAGLAVRGKIDRIDRHEQTGAIRLLDYKTADTPSPPAEAHCRRPRRDGSDAARPGWARFEIEGRELVWTDLQLPLYLHAAAEEFGAAAECGYFNLPKAAGETALALWDGYSAAWQAAALRCATGVATAVAAGEFWPPTELPARDDEAWAGLFHQGAAASVAWEGAS